uniref:Uncharacterized protein n=1 Tax=Strigamia maritima TaxID=126957 RepID=T1JCS8_STRMM
MALILHWALNGRWFKQNQTDGDFVCKTSELMNNFHINYDCSNYKLNAVDYFNSNGILQQEVVATSLEQLTDNIVSDVDINFNTSILVVSYENILSRFLHLSVARPVDFLSFSAQLRVDKFANRLLTFELNDFLIGQYYYMPLLIASSVNLKIIGKLLFFTLHMERSSLDRSDWILKAVKEQ